MRILALLLLVACQGPSGGCTAEERCITGGGQWIVENCREHTTTILMPMDYGNGFVSYIPINQTNTVCSERCVK